jgi:uncharacterized membrane protein YecN with MAPEG domain
MCRLVKGAHDPTTTINYFCAIDNSAPRKERRSGAAASNQCEHGPRGNRLLHGSKWQEDSEERRPADARQTPQPTNYPSASLTSVPTNSTHTKLVKIVRGAHHRRAITMKTIAFLLLVSYYYRRLFVVDAFITPTKSFSAITNSLSSSRRQTFSRSPRDTTIKKDIVWPSPTRSHDLNASYYLAMSSSAATVTMALPIATSTFWIGFYGLLQITLWIKIMTIRAVQPSSTHQLQNLAVSQDIRNLRATRAHGNYTENAPIFSLLLLVVDAMNVVPKLVVNVLGGLFFFGRIFHMMGMWAYEGSSIGRIVGALFTMASLVLGSCMSIYSAIDVMGGVSISGVQVKLGIIAMIVVIGNCFAGIKTRKKKSK